MKNRILLLSTMVFMVFSSCEKEKPLVVTNDDDGKTDTEVDFKLTFKPKFNGQDLTFNEMKWINDANDTMNFTRLRMILSNIELVKTNGEKVMLDTFAYLSFDEGRTVLGFEGEMPQGEFKGINFLIGLDSAINHGDPMQWALTHPLNPLVNHMHWTWASGYIFWVAEGYYMNNGDDFGIMSYHMANMEYTRKIELTTTNTFSFSNGKISREIDLNMEKYFSTPNAYSLKNNGALSHSNSPADRERMTLLHANMANIFVLK